jgi:PEP-CTERM motif
VIPEPSSMLLLALGFVVAGPALRAFAKGNRAAPLA